MSAAEPAATAGPTTGQGPLFLVDGNSLAYRAFYALPESIATTEGQPTNAIYGFASMMVKILTDHRPSAVIVCWDAGMSGREVVFPEYKAQRSSKPGLLREQWPHLAPLVDAFGFTNVRVEGFEADDVIATLAERCREQEIPVMIVTGDRDAYQLVTDGVQVMHTSRGVTDTRIYDREGVIDRYGIPPELVPDLIGLRGDTSDNIPGVPGIGEKTAAQLLQQFGSVETVLASIDEVSGAKRKENLTNFADDARTGKALAILHRDLDVQVDPADLVGAGQDRTDLREFARRFELRVVIERLEEGLDDAEVIPDDPGERELHVEAREGRPDELDGEGPVAVATVGEAWAASRSDQAVTGTADAAGLAGQRAGQQLIAHDAKSLGGGRGGALGVDPSLVLAHDTMLAAYLINPARRVYDLDDLCVEEGLRPAGGDEISPDGQMELGASEPAGPDPATRARLTWELADRQRTLLEQFGLTSLLTEVEQPLVAVLAAMERSGVLLDIERLGEIAGAIREEAGDLERRIWELAGREFTIGSPQQLAQVFFEELGLTRKRRGKTGYSTDAQVLRQIRDEHEIVGLVERWRELTKLTNTYLDALPQLVDAETGRIHTTFRQATATTGRLSSINPNLQNIPIRSEVGRPIRGCFVAAPGNLLVSCDYEQVELRILAHVAGEDVLKQIFAAGEDVHEATAAQVFGLDPSDVGVTERSKAKAVNYGIVYGLSAFGLSDQLQIGRDEAQEFIDRYLGRFPAVQQFIASTIEQATEEGHVSTLMGRRRPIPELRARRWNDRQLGERLAVNTVIQGTAADIIKVAMVRCHRALVESGAATRLVLQIHDELLLEGPEDEASDVAAMATREMCAAFELDPPLVVEPGIGPDWLSAK
ncbi:MAG: DNA polymerase I [Solirubrobacterales bacterium]